MPDFDRRRFLIGSGVIGGLGLLAGGSAITWEQLHSAAQTSPLASGSGVLVLVTLYGGNDGINTLIPYADKAYHDARPELAYNPSEVLHLDDQLGLNPAMKGMAAMWKQRSLAVVRGVGYPQPDHSHFRSMDIWQTASPAEPVKTGWVGRWLDATGDDPLRAVNIGSVLPPLSVGEKATAAALDVGKQPLPSDLAGALAQLAATDAADTSTESAVCASYRAERSVAQTFAPITGHAPAPAKATGGKQRQNELESQLDLVGRCVKAGVPTRVYSVSLNGFDTHADEKGTQQTVLGTLDSAVSKFLADMATDRYGRNVVLMAYSEFGRRVAANASQGTDHGTAGPVFVAGAPVRGGFYGDEPSLTNLDNGDLKSTTDFRDVYHTLLDKVVGTDPTPAVGAGRSDLGFVA
ncbi:DUF1501 domain-containing protein [Antrihabitans cavernicola]|uniref:DUF1501 domain-containing protein n=1 Tax=Antrihabitans cavernicola TaxID=2495913 RepID=A0A5A7SDA1_9NOCA|nr:DUF1501 domain-containing protein [Spelaeibacter cavernicola]KAA0024130.1 DUF1501 domain-containing protein [Spelaeibacter cavernicola]